MDSFEQLRQWLSDEARFLDTNGEVFERFCREIIGRGVPLERSWLHIRTLHPQYAGVSRLWVQGASMRETFLPHDFESRSTYLTSPIRYAVENRRSGRWRLKDGALLPFPMLAELRAEGYCDYLVAPLLYSDRTPNAITWATRAEGGFEESQVKLLQELIPAYSAVAEIKSLRRFAINMLQTYTGREPGELILKGQIRRGDVRNISAALMLIDLRDFTLMSDRLEPTAVIETLNRYFDSVMIPVKRHGGEVMEIMGDGVLAIFNDSLGGPGDACRRAFAAATEGLMALACSNQGVDGHDKLVAGFALHHGSVAYGNIGSGDRLDFTVIGRDVNLTSRIEKLCRELGRQLIMSELFVRMLEEPMFEIGHFALRGVPEMQLLYGLPPDFPIDDAAAVAAPSDEE